MLSGRTLLQHGPAAAQADPLADFMAGDPTGRSGVSIAATGTEMLTATADPAAVTTYRIGPAGVTAGRAFVQPAPAPVAVTTAPASLLAEQPSGAVSEAAVLAFAEAHVGQVVPTRWPCSAPPWLPRLCGRPVWTPSRGWQRPARTPCTTPGVRPCTRVIGRGHTPRSAGLGGIRPGDILQLDGYSESRPDGTWVAAAHHTAVVEAVDVQTGRLSILQQNFAGNAATAHGELEPSDQTAGVLTAYRP